MMLLSTVSNAILSNPTKAQEDVVMTTENSLQMELGDDDLYVDAPNNGHVQTNYITNGLMNSYDHHQTERYKAISLQAVDKVADKYPALLPHLYDVKLAGMVFPSKPPHTISTN